MEVLYKYRRFSAQALEMLIKRQVYFATPDKLNDPYDCRISIRQALSEKFTTHHNDEQIVGMDEVVYCGGNPFSDFFEEIAALS